MSEHADRPSKEYMPSDQILNEQILSRLEEMNTHLSNIHRHMLWVFWLVAVFALLYFGLLIYLMT